MAQQPRRSVSRPDYVALSSVKLLRSRKINHDTRTVTESNSDSNSDELYRLRVVDEDDAMVKVRYIGYSSDFDEWRRKDDIVELSDDESSSESDGGSRQRSLGSLQRFCLFEELALRIKELLISSRKKDPMCRIVMSFDRMSFDSLLIRATLVPKAGTRTKRSVYSIQHMTQFEDLLGNRWYIRGLNAAGDFCFVTPGSVRLYLRVKKGRIDYQLKSDGTLFQEYFGKGFQLVFSFIRGDGTLAQWNTVLKKCKA